MHRHWQRHGHRNFIFGPVFGIISPVRLLYRETYLCKTTSNKGGKSSVNCKHFRKQWLSRSDLLFIHSFFFYLLFLTQVHMLLALFITSIDLIPIKKKSWNYELIIFVLLMSDHQFLFGFVFCPFSFSLEDVENSWQSGAGVVLRSSVGLQ